MGKIAKLVNRTARHCALPIVLVVFAAVPSAAGAASAPSWSIVASSYPTRFVSGSIGSKDSPPGYLLLVTNDGGAPTDGVFTITDTLPAGLGFSTAAGAYGHYGGQNTALACGVAGSTVSCSSDGPSLQPGEVASLIIPVSVAPGSSGTVVDEATISGGGAAAVATSTETTVGDGFPFFGFLPGTAGFDSAISNQDGSLATLAGSHPYQFTAGMNFPSGYLAGGLFAVGGGIKDLGFDLPSGMVVDPGAMPARCTESELKKGGCPDTAQAGTVALAFSLTGGAPTVVTVALYAMVPPPGAPVEFGLELTGGAFMHLRGGMQSDDAYRLSADVNDILAKFAIVGAQVTLWGRPSDESHDHVRGDCVIHGGACPVTRTNAAFLTLPGACGASLMTAVSADSWLEPGLFSIRSVEGPVVEGCNALAFDPTLSAKPTTGLSDSPTGFEVALHLPQSNDYEGRAEAGVRNAQVTLPEGLVVSPSAAYGLGACSANQVGLTTAVGQPQARFTAAPATCPDSAKIGTAEIDTPILDRPLSGAVYIAKPGENPFGTLLALYVAIDDPVTGIVVKLPARLDADSRTGRLTLRLADLPQLPLEDVKLNLFQGSRSVLKTPLGCGIHTTASDLTPWSSPEGANATPADSFRTSAAVAGGACPAGEAEAPSRPTYAAGSVAPRAGAFSPFVLRLSRRDGSQRLAAIDTTLPAGVTARLAGIPPCSDAAAVAGRCPATSRVGAVSLTAGAGPTPLPLAGNVYLAGPYKGAPMSLAIVVPAIAGPFDLGTVAVRVALYLDPRLARIHAVSDPLPTILRGIPLDIRSLAVNLDRPGFALNPTSCEPTSVTTTVTSAVGQGAALTDRFQVGDCGALGFRPEVSARLLGRTHRGAHPRLRAVLTPRAGDANIRAAAITLPGTELLDSRRTGTTCSVAEFNAERCPASSIYGYARAWTPLLEQPLQGPVYLRASEQRLPDLAASLGGRVHVDLAGRIDSVHGRLRVGFGSLPDVPLDRLVLNMRGGRRGLLVNSGGVCREKLRAAARFASHNGRTSALRPLLRTDCGRKGG